MEKKCTCIIVISAIQNTFVLLSQDNFENIYFDAHRGTRTRQFAGFFFELDISKIRKGSTWTSVFHIKNEGRASSNVKSGFIFHSEVKKARPKGMKIAFFPY